MICSRALDLRFHSADDEAAFRKSLEPGPLRFGSIGSAAGFLWVIASMGWYGAETAQSAEVSSHHVSVGDCSRPRIWHFAISLYVAAQFAVGFACLVLRERRGMFKALDAERFFHGVVCVNLLLMSIGSRCSAALIFGMEPSEVWRHGSVQGDASRSLLVHNCALLFLCLFARVRALLALTLPLAALGPELVLRLVCGTRFVGPAPADYILCGVSSVLVLLWALAAEGSARAEWQAAAKRREADFQGEQGRMSSMEAAAQTLCQIVVGLDSQSLVMRPHPQLTTFFGTAILGMDFAELLCNDDKPRFEEFISRSSPGMQRCMPVTLKHTSLAGTCRAMLLVMCMGENAPATYLVGIKLLGTSWSMPLAAQTGELAADVPSMLPVVPSWSHQSPSSSDFDVVWTDSVKVGTSEPAFAEASTQVDAVLADGVPADPVATIDRCGNTDLTWCDAEFVCGACMRAQQSLSQCDSDCASRSSFGWETEEWDWHTSKIYQDFESGEVASPAALAGARPSEDWPLSNTHQAFGSGEAASPPGKRRKRRHGQEKCSDAMQPQTGRLDEERSATRGPSAASSSSLAYWRGPSAASSSSSADWRHSSAASTSFSFYSPPDSDSSVCSYSSADSHSSASDIEPPGEESEASLDGVWLSRGHPDSVNPWLRSLTISGSTVIDGNNDVTFVEYKHGCPYLAGGRLTRDGDMLFRVGKGTMKLTFDLQPAGRCWTQQAGAPASESAVGELREEVAAHPSPPSGGRGMDQWG